MMSDEFVSKTNDHEQLKFKAKAASKMVNASTSNPESVTLHKAAHETLNQAEETIDSVLCNSKGLDHLYAEKQNSCIEKVHEQFMEANIHESD